MKTCAAVIFAGTFFLSTAARAQDADADLYERMCGSCHSINPGAVAMQGPHLRGVYGRKAGTVRGYAYSAALKNFEAVWNDVTLYAYLNDPTVSLPGTKKRTAVKDSRQLNRIIRYLQSTQSVPQTP